MEVAQPVQAPYTSGYGAGAGIAAAGAGAAYGSQTSQGTGFTQYPSAGTVMAGTTDVGLDADEGEPATCIRPHIPQLSDELLLSPGDKVLIQKSTLPNDSFAIRKEHVRMGG